MSSGDYTGALSLCLHLQALNCFGEHQLTVDTFLGEEANHAVTGKQLAQLTEGATATVTDTRSWF